MKSLWSDAEAATFGGDALGLRVYTSRLLGRDASLVLHGGGNTSVKDAVHDLFGNRHEVLYVKGSGHNLATIGRDGFAPVRLEVLQRLAEIRTLSDTALVREQRSAMTDPTAPDPSVEAVLHAIIPFKFVDHTHADAVIALTNTPDSDRVMREVFGDQVLLIPYVMPGFSLARLVYELTRNGDWTRYEGMVLLNHGVFTWGDTARASYEAMIALVERAERYLDRKGALSLARGPVGSIDLPALSAIRRAVSDLAGAPMIARFAATPEAVGFSDLPDVRAIATRGPLTPDHVIRTKRVPVVFGKEPLEDIRAFAAAYREYFDRHNNGQQKMLDSAPRWAVWPGSGVVAFGTTPAQARIALDISEHTIAAMQWAAALGGWQPLDEKDLFDVEYWELEQAKLEKAGAARALDGKSAIVTGAASGIGRAAAVELASQGASVIAVDMTPVESAPPGIVPLRCDLTDPGAADVVADEAVRQFGGLDILVSNVGILPPSQRIADLDETQWQRALEVNLTSHQRLLKACIPYLKHGIDPTVIVVASKNVPAPGPGQAAYSVAKAGLTQLCRVAALELAGDGVRVNVIHPHAVFDTGLWTPEVLAQRAAAYGMSVEQYRRGNLLGVEVSSRTVASLIAALAGPAFACTTGAQIPIDGGNERVI